MSQATERIAQVVGRHLASMRVKELTLLDSIAPSMCEVELDPDHPLTNELLENVAENLARHAEHWTAYGIPDMPPSAECSRFTAKGVAVRVCDVYKMCENTRRIVVTIMGA